jgi:hypothetical protein
MIKKRGRKNSRIIVNSNMKGASFATIVSVMGAILIIVGIA